MKKYYLLLNTGIIFECPEQPVVRNYPHTGHIFEIKRASVIINGVYSRSAENIQLTTSKDVVIAQWEEEEMGLMGGAGA